MAIKELICAVALATATPAMAQQDTVIIPANEVATDSISRAPSDKHCSVELAVDYPRDGAQPLTDSLRSYIATELRAFYMPRLDGDGLPRPATYTGSLADGKALVDFHAEHLLADMQDVYQSWVNDSGPADIYMINQSSIRKTSETDSIVTYEASCYTFEGGAHGSYWLEGATFNKQDGQRMEIDLDPMKLDDMQPLLREGYAKYLNDNGAEITVDEILKGGVFLTDGLIPLPSSNPYLTKEGVKFVYQQYEIGPYAIGTPTFTIPLDELKPYLFTPEQGAE